MFHKNMMSSKELGLVVKTVKQEYNQANKVLLLLITFVSITLYSILILDSDKYSSFTRVKAKHSNPLQVAYL